MERAARSLFALPPRCLKILTGQQDNTATRDPPGWPLFYRCESCQTVWHPPRHEWQGFLRSPRWFCRNLCVPPTTALLQRRTT